MKYPECNMTVLSSSDYLCSRCREVADGAEHPFAGKTIKSVIGYDDMRGIRIVFEDGSEVQAVYHKYIEKGQVYV